MTAEIKHHSLATVREASCNNLSRKYKAVRLTSHWYGGIPTWDMLGCWPGSCKMCWLDKSRDPEWISEHGKFRSPTEVALEISNYPVARLSGSEPTLNLEHLLILAAAAKDTQILIETNGVLLSKPWVVAFSKLSNIHFRLSLKGCDGSSSTITTGIDLYSKQLETVELLSEHGLKFHCSLLGIYSDYWINKVEKDIQGLCPKPAHFFKSSSRFYGAIELEKLSVYPFNRQRIELWIEELKKEGYYDYRRDYRRSKR